MEEREVSAKASKITNGAMKQDATEANGHYQTTLNQCGIDARSAIFDQIMVSHFDASFNQFEYAVMKHVLHKKYHGHVDTMLRSLREQLEIRSDFTQLLPNELLLHIFSYLDARDICNLALVNRTLRALQEDSSLWRLLYQRRHNLDNRFANSQSTDLYPSKRQCIDYHQLYARHHQMELNWRKGRLREVHIPFDIEPSELIECLHFSCSRLACGFRNSHIKLLDMDTGASLLRLRGHQSEVRCLQLTSTSSSNVDESLLLSGSNDTHIKIWRTSTGECLQTLLGHKRVVYCLASSEATRPHHIFSGSDDTTTRVWDCETGACLHVLNGHTDAVLCLGLDSYSTGGDGATLVSGSEDGSVVLWCLRTMKKIDTIAQGASVWCLNYRGALVVAAHEDRTMRSYDVRMRRCRQVMTGHEGHVCSLQFDDSGKLVSGATDKRIKVWDVNNGNMLATLPLRHNNAVYCLQYDEQILLSFSFGQLMVADFSPAIW